ncbi:MAG: hypothetical protein QOG64_151, partial [Acidimicrobiaceae bacterium]|nr:hypothetical protein [Acidimicrobiaceae bacterium]
CETPAIGIARFAAFLSGYVPEGTDGGGAAMSTDRDELRATAGGGRSAMLRRIDHQSARVRVDGEIAEQQAATVELLNRMAEARAEARRAARRHPDERATP